MMKALNSIKTFLFLLLFLGVGTLWSQTESTIDYLNVAGTFQFESPSGKTLFLRMDVIETLYPDINDRRKDDIPVYWEYNEDMTIIIFSREFIESEDFVPLESPYKGFSIKEIK